MKNREMAAILYIEQRKGKYSGELTVKCMHIQDKNIIPNQCVLLLQSIYSPSFPHYSTGSSSSKTSKLKGWNATPSPKKCLLIASTQCNLSECNIALVPSMTHSTKTVRINQRPNRTKIARTPTAPLMPKAIPRVIFHRTMESC